jgi:SAM-dependent methyltransferase
LFLYNDEVTDILKKRTVENSISYVIDHIQPGLSLLDVGCGPGSITVELAERLAPGRVVGVDSHTGILESARGLAAVQGLGNVEFQLADAHELPFPDGSFDIVHCHQVLLHIPDAAAVVKEMRRVCRPGGIVTARECDRETWSWFPGSPALEEMKSLQCAVSRADGVEPAAGRRLLSWALQAGFDDVTASASTFCVATPESRVQYRDMWIGRLTGPEFAESLRGGLADRLQVDRMVQACRDWASAPDGWFVAVNGEIVCRK